MTTEMPKAYYKIYGEQTGTIAGALYLTEACVHEICANLNLANITKEKISYAKVDISQYNKIKTGLNKKIFEQ